MPRTTDRRLRIGERATLALSGVLGVAAAMWAFASRELTDFLGEGPVRVLSLSDGAQQTTIAIGTLVAAVAWTAVAWSRLPLWRYALGAGAVLVALALAPALFVPIAALFALAAGFAVFLAMSPERRAALMPSRHPRLWAGGGVVAVGGLVVASVVSVWLLRPLFDEGKELDEALAFELPAAVATPSVPPASGLASGAGATSTPGAGVPVATTGAASAVLTPAASSAPTQAAAAAPTQAATTQAAPTQAAAPQTATPSAAPTQPPASSGAAVLATGELQGTDAFHFGSGKVLLVRGPDGQLVLRFEGYEVRNGPDLFVYLSPDAGGDPEARGALNLGGIKATRGNVNYEVPAGTDVSGFRSAVIWCRSFDVVFAVATFQ